MAKAKVPDDLKRKPCYGKVSPETREYLNGMEESNDGRRVDRLVSMAIQQKPEKIARKN